MIDSVSLQRNIVARFRITIFCISKVPELIDTLFIVLRKQKLIFLHWFHHATVLIYAWYSYHDWTASGRWFVFMNYTVHGRRKILPPHLLFILPFL